MSVRLRLPEFSPDKADHPGLRRTSSVPTRTACAPRHGLRGHRFSQRQMGKGDVADRNDMVAGVRDRRRPSSVLPSFSPSSSESKREESDRQDTVFCVASKQAIGKDRDRENGKRDQAEN
jgi:hypothetical protein